MSVGIARRVFSTRVPTVVSREHLLPRFREIAFRMGIAEDNLRAWYRIKRSDFVQAGGRYLLRQSQMSLPALLMYLYPEHSWDQSQFLVKPRVPLSDKKADLERLRALGERLGIPKDTIDTSEEWYHIRHEDIVKCKGEALLKRYNGSLYRMLLALLPEHPWDPNQFKFKPRNFWDSRENQLKFISELSEKLNIKEGDMNAWYKVTWREVGRYNGRGILKHFGSSVPKMLASIFPDHDWDPSKFRFKPKDFWNSIENQKSFLIDVGAKYGYKEGNWEPWYGLTCRVIASHGGKGLLMLYGNSPYTIMSVIFPEHTWDPMRFRVGERRRIEMLDSITADAINDDKTINL